VLEIFTIIKDRESNCFLLYLSILEKIVFLEIGKEKVYFIFLQNKKF